MLEKRQYLKYHHNGDGGAHDLFHKAKESAKKSLDIFVKQPPTFDGLVQTGEALMLYHDSLESIIRTASGTKHSEEEKELARIKKIMAEARQMRKAHLS